MTIKKQAFTRTSLPPDPDPGEAVFVTNSSAQTYSWLVPANVYRISAVTVSCPTYSGNHTFPKISRGGTVLLAPNSTLGSGGVGGGNGGAVGAGGFYSSGGPGGAGGYTGNGGAGGASTAVSGGYGSNGAAGSGGGGGGAGGPNTVVPVVYGGPVGLLGQGSNGAGGVSTTDGRGGAGSNMGGTLCGSGYPAGNLRWLNDIPVTPGETITIAMSVKNPTDNVYGINEGVRLIWGNDGRSYPSNAGDYIPKGQAVITLANTTFTVPNGVTSLCACAQQQDGSKAAVTVVVGGVTVLRAQNGARIGDGGGDGGSSTYGGGGGGGYTGNGGNGGTGTSTPSDGSGGGGAGGPSGGAVWVEDPVVGGSGNSPGHLETYPPGAGGGVGISGQGASGTASSPQGSPDAINGYMGGGPAYTAGGALAWKNAIAVTPGQVITVNAAGGRVRFIWGPGRSYPSAAGNV